MYDLKKAPDRNFYVDTGYGFKLVKRTAGMAKSASGHFSHGAAASGNKRCDHERRRIPNAAR